MENHIDNINSEKMTVSKYINKKGGIDAILKSQKTNLACIISGTGSGKSYWIKNYLGKTGKVLYVTSRAAKVLQDKDKLRDNNCFHTSFDGICNTVCTSWALWEQIKKICSNVSREVGMKNLDDFINKYDYIVFDEFHSLVCDSLFSDGIFNVAVFFCYCVFEKKKKTIVLTATKHPVKFFIKAISKTLRQNMKTNGMVELDLTDKCDYVLPKTIRIIDRNKKKNEKITRLLDSGSNIIYFMNFVGEKAANNKNYGYTIHQEYDYLIEEYGLKEDEVAVIISKGRQEKWDEDHNCEKTKTSSIKKDTNGDFAKLTFNEWVREEISLNQEIPDGVRVVLCSATLNEGISIENEKNPFTHAITDAHYISTLIQQMGRLRNNLKEFWVINNARQHNNFYEIEELKLLTSKLENDQGFLKYLTEYAENIKDFKERYQFIGWICKHKKFDLMEYSYITHRFEFNNLKYNMINEVERVERKCKDFGFEKVGIWEKEFMNFAHKYNIIFFSSPINENLDLLIQKADVEKHIETIIGKKFYGVEWNEEKLILKNLGLGVTKKTVNKKLKEIKVHFELVQSKTTTHGKFTYWFSSIK